jgi:nitrate/nitrite transporter NarK
MMGFFGVVVPLWTLPASFLTSASAAAGIAFINVAGNLGQFTGPSLMGVLSDRTHSYSLGLIFLAAVALCCAVLMASQHNVRRHITELAGR